MKIPGLAETKSSVEWLEVVLGHATKNTWTDLQVRIIRDKSAIVAIGQEGADSRLVLRARINRRMQEVAVLEGRKAESVVNVIKANSGLSTGVAIEPLDGLYRYAPNPAPAEGQETPKTQEPLDIRVAVFPTHVGETIALRLPSTDGILTLDELRLTDHNLERLNRVLGLSNGLVVVAGPMGSGKSTSLRTFLRILGTPDQSVWAVEDPVELQIDGVEQIGINSGAGNGWPEVLTGLRRSDLEVLMIGEIRNYDQASAALEIGNAGAKVISSIHANDSVGAVMQLMELSKAQPHTLGNQLRSVISQRLLRLVCTECRGEESAMATCERCDETGYKGVRPIHEILTLSEEFIGALAGNASVGELRAVAARDGMKTLRETAQEVLDAGETDLAEVRRVLGHD